MKPQSLYRVENELARVLHEHVDLDTGEITVDGLVALQSLELDRDQVFLALAALVKDYKMHAEAIDAVIDERTNARNDAISKAESICKIIAKRLEPGRKLEDGNASIGWKVNPGKVEILDEKAAMEDGYKITPEPKPPEPRVDKKVLRLELLAEFKISGKRYGSLERPYAILHKPYEVKIS